MKTFRSQIKVFSSRDPESDWFFDGYMGYSSPPTAEHRTKDKASYWADFLAFLGAPLFADGRLYWHQGCTYVLGDLGDGAQLFSEDGTPEFVQRLPDSVDT